jgi:hypothetical protein
MNEHEIGFVDFLAGKSRRRIQALFELGPKRRGDVRALLDHEIELDPRYCRHLTGRESLAGAVEELLLSLGAPKTCFVISASSDLDGREMPLADALEAVAHGYSGAFLSCIAGKLGYFEYEDRQSGYLLRK